MSRPEGFTQTCIEICRNKPVSTGQAIADLLESIELVNNPDEMVEEINEFCAQIGIEIPDWSSKDEDE